MMLLTKENRKQLPPLYSQEHVEDPMVWVKFFTPWTNYTAYGIEFDGEDIFFGWVCGHDKELGYFSLKEWASIRGPFGLKVERDRYFRPMPLSEVKRLHAARGAANPKAVASHCHWQTTTGSYRGRLTWAPYVFTHSHEGGLWDHGHRNTRSFGRTKEALMNNEFRNPVIGGLHG